MTSFLFSQKSAQTPGSCDDCFFHPRYCDRTLLLLLRTFLDIIALRKGPEHVPDSWLLFVLSILMMVFASLSAAALIEALAEQDFRLTFAANVLGLTFYGAVLFVFGYSRRILPALTSVIGCGAILTMLFVAEFVRSGLGESAIRPPEPENASVDHSIPLQQSARDAVH